MWVEPKTEKCPAKLKIGCHGNRAEVLLLWSFRMEEDGVLVESPGGGGRRIHLFRHCSPHISYNCSVQAMRWKHIVVSGKRRAEKALVLRLVVPARLGSKIEPNVCYCGGKIYL